MKEFTESVTHSFFESLYLSRWQGRRQGWTGPFRGVAPYLRDAGIADLRHDVADVLEDKKPCVQASEVEFILNVVVYDFSTPDHVLETNKRLGIKAGQ